MSNEGKQQNIDERDREIRKQVRNEMRREEEVARVIRNRVGDTVGTAGDKLFVRRSKRRQGPSAGTPGYTSFLN